MDVILMHQTVTNHDAIGNDIEAMYFLLKKVADCYVYADNQFNTSVEYIGRQDLERVIRQKDCVIIYHHSVYWEDGYRILKMVKGKIIFRYHNITPEYFFEKYNAFHFEQCKLGRNQTDIFVKEFPQAVWIADSHYNAQDLVQVDETKLFVCPPFHKIEQWSQEKPDEAILKGLLENDEINLLFVGRVVPNKGHLMLLDILRIFCLNYSEKIRLRIIGKFDEALTGYNELIYQLINEYGLGDKVEFIGEINDAVLLSYYLGSDFLICTSEHEGFCVPIIEAQYLGIPVITLAECAVPETAGNNQVILDKTSSKFAAAIHLIYHNQEYYDYLSQQGRKNYDLRFTYETISQIFTKIIMKDVGA